MTADPITRFRRWFAQAQRTGMPLPEAMALATADARGRPSVRFVLLKQADARGFLFFTDGRSRKGRELRDNPYASVAFYWDPLGRQVRVEGRIAPVTAAEADAYWATRPKPSQLAALTSHQSAPAVSRAWLTRRWNALRRLYGDKDTPRPPKWTGFRLIPHAIEFWTRHEHRLHYRDLYTRTSRGWKRTALQP